MAVNPYPRDGHGALLQANLTALQANTVSAASPAAQAILRQTDQLQRELVYHYLDTGRITAAAILSTLS